MSNEKFHFLTSVGNLQARWNGSLQDKDTDNSQTIVKENLP